MLDYVIQNMKKINYFIKKIVLKKYENEQKGKVKGGQTGVRKSSYTRDEALKNI